MKKAWIRTFFYWSSQQRIFRVILNCLLKLFPVMATRVLKKLRSQAMIIESGLPAPTSEAELSASGKEVYRLMLNMIQQNNKRVNHVSTNAHSA
ncbi:MAG: hypothetical protein MUO63_13650 [Desulfobulbaceae bacterium]|nr:hypothetical protein [Desulfobulbaceae bacterium]